ncbi:AraC family transcriptional regulator [Gracilibacillus salinarum]|uniref:AraC family transcriptional regulator n=1 Tax=Gracilibacillus salinarum TaxID=2932255 RepID=A0ABY4GQF8_9BACI|nr:AraC family transcriptional regulator [Gracilibacillus salinarum]UOQ86479.1 AraC family transcriptional regulator [Gracilibacillus salinarum]
MTFIKLDIETPVNYISGGLFETDQHWSHKRRIIDNYEMIIGVNETLFIEQDGVQYDVQPGDVLFLFPDKVHNGYKICNKHVSFYWFHFECNSISTACTINDDMVLHIRTNPEAGRKIKSIYFPKFSPLMFADRLNILANQLLDVDNSNYYSRMSVNYLMTALLIEFSEQTFVHSSVQASTFNERDMNINHILEWTRIHAFNGISVSTVADRFSYNKEYLSRYFKRKTGKTLQSYIHALRISKAKDLLVGTRQNLKVIAKSIGIEDEKYFMRLFKKYEKMTPTEYRKAFGKTRLNRH